MISRLLPAMAMACALLVASGCGEEEGPADGATVTAYVAAPLCEGAEREAEAGRRPGGLRVSVRCLAEVDSGDLAAIAANARQVSEDSSAVAYAEPAGTANRFGPPIVEAAGIAVIYTSSGQLAMSRIVRAVRRAEDSAVLRDAVAVELGVD